MRFRQAVIARLAEVESADALREGSLDSSPGGVLHLEGRCGLPFTRGADGLVLGLRSKRQTARRRCGSPRTDSEPDPSKSTLNAV